MTKWVDSIDDWFEVVQCSKCEHRELKKYKSKYCSNCGAYMTNGEKKEK